MVWERHSGPTPTEKTGPDNDHTFERYNNSGHYLFVNMNQHAMNDDKRKLSGFASNAVINSIVFNPPPYAHLNTSSIYQHSCLVCTPFIVFLLLSLLLLLYHSLLVAVRFHRLKIQLITLIRQTFSGFSSETILKCVQQTNILLLIQKPCCFLFN